MEKPGIKRSSLICKCIFMTLMLLAGMITLIMSLVNANSYRSTQGVAVTARVTRIDEYEDSEGSTDYDVFVEYTYDGQVWNQEYTEINGAKARVGDLETIHINPADPMQIMEETASNAKTFCIVAGAFLAVGAGLSGIRIRQDYCEAFGISRENIETDLRNYIRSERGWQVTAAIALCLGTGAIAGCGSVVLYLVLVASLVLTIVFLIKHSNRARAFKNEAYSIRRDRLVSQKIEKDSDDNDQYYLFYANSEGATYRIHTNRKTYGQVKPGDEIIAVYFDGNKKPYMNIHLHDRSVV